MSITPLEKQQVSGSAVAVYEGLEKRGKVINFFKVLAYKPEILKTFLDFYQEVWREGKLPAVTKELAYLRTSILNGCAYLNARTYRFGEAAERQRRADCSIERPSRLEEFGVQTRAAGCHPLRGKIDRVSGRD